jgi:hypothetical protein
VQKVFARLANADLVACWFKWKRVHQGVLELEVLDHSDDIVSRGGKALVHAKECREEVTGGIEDLLAGVAGTKGVLALSNFSYKQRQEMALQKEADEKAKQAKEEQKKDQEQEGEEGEDSGNDSLATLLYMGDSKFAEREYILAQDLYTQFVHQMQVGELYHLLPLLLTQALTLCSGRGAGRGYGEGL